MGGSRNEMFYFPLLVVGFFATSRFPETNRPKTMIFSYLKWAPFFKGNILVFGCVYLYSLQGWIFLHLERKRFPHSEATVLSGEGGSDGSTWPELGKWFTTRECKTLVWKLKFELLMGKSPFFLVNKNNHEDDWFSMTILVLLDGTSQLLRGANQNSDNIHLSDGHLTVILLMGLEVLQSTCMGFAWTIMKV